MIVTGFRQAKDGSLMNIDFDTKNTFANTKKIVDKALGISAAVCAFGLIDYGSRIFSTSIGTKLLGPSLEVIAKPIAQTPAGGAGFYEMFRDVTLPYVYDMGNAMVLVFFSLACYQIIRKEHKQGFEKVKWVAAGFIILHCVDPFILFINRMSNEISKALSNSIQSNPKLDPQTFNFITDIFKFLG